MAPTVLVTGAAGFLGGETVAHLRGQYRVVAVDRERPADPPGDRFVVADLLDAGETAAVLDEADPAAVAHLGTIPHPDNHPGAPTFRSNVLTSYNLLAASAATGVDRLCLASSVNAIGRSFQAVPTEVEYLPIDEAHPATPRDPYGVAKLVVERVADGFGRRPGPPTTVSTLRFPAVFGLERLERWESRPLTLPELREAASGGRVPHFEYVTVRDAARAVEHALAAGFAGHETFWIAAADTRFEVSTPEYVAEFYPEVECRRSFAGHETLIDISKARALLDWAPEQSWRDVQ